MTWYKGKNGGGGSGSELALLKGWGEITGFLDQGIQNATRTFNCNIGDFVVVIDAVPSNVTGLELLGSIPGTTYYCAVYKATATTITITGTGRGATAFVFLNSKAMSDAFTGLDLRITANSVIPANKGDLYITNWGSIVPWNNATDPESINFCHLLPMGLLQNDYWFMVTETNMARLWVSGSTYYGVVIHFS